MCSVPQERRGGPITERARDYAGRGKTRPYKSGVFCARRADFRLFCPVRENRRNSGVNRVKQGRAPKKILKILLTENARCTILPLAPVTAFPPKYVPTFLSYPHAGQSQRRSTGVLTIRKRVVEFIGNG